MPNLSPELNAVTIITIFTGLMWVPIILNRLREDGIWNALKTGRPDTRAASEWAWRLENAHRNAIENLVVFAPLAITIHAISGSNSLTAFASTVFIFARIAHAIIYTLGIPLLRTIAFAIGFAVQMVLGLTILGIL